MGVHARRRSTRSPRSFRVITFSLCGELAAVRASTRRGASTTSSDQIDAALDSRGIDSARSVRRLVRRPDRRCASPRRRRSGPSALVLVSAPGPALASEEAPPALRAVPVAVRSGVSRRDRRGDSGARSPAPFPSRRTGCASSCGSSDDARPRAADRSSRMAERAGLIGIVDVARELRDGFRARRSWSRRSGSRPRRRGRQHVGVRDADSDARAASRSSGPDISATITRPDGFAAIVREFVEARSRRQDHAA